jgi:hypothetical protein
MRLLTYRSRPEPVIGPRFARTVAAVPEWKGV